MKISECQLRLDYQESHGDIVLRFMTEHLGIRMYLCTIRKNTSGRLIQNDSKIYPDVFTRTSYRMIYGVKSFTHDYAVIGDDNQEDYIAFFRCTGRSGRERIFAYASEHLGRDAGGRFFVGTEDYESIKQTLKSIELKTLGEQAAASNGDKRP